MLVCLLALLLISASPESFKPSLIGLELPLIWVDYLGGAMICLYACVLKSTDIR